MNSSKYKWILWDADGTLFDYDRAEVSALKETFEQLGLGFEPRYVEAYRRINAQIWLEFEQGQLSQDHLKTERFRLLFEAVGVRADPALFSARYLKNLGDGTDLIEGAEETLQSLYGKIGMVLITNGLANVQRARLAKSTIGDCFAEIVISEEVGAAKPDTEIFDVAFSRMGNPKKEEVLIVGDSLTSDIRGGSDYGIDTCWFNPLQRVCDLDVAIRYGIGHLNELLSIVL